jgi:hypothetical protein
MDFWAVNVCLLLFGTIEAVVFSWVFGIDKAWKELNTGGEIRVGRFFRFICRYVTPSYLIVILVAWIATEGWGVITLADVKPEETVPFLGMTLPKAPFITGFRILLLALLLAFNLVIHRTWKKRNIDGRLAAIAAGEDKL